MANDWGSAPTGAAGGDLSGVYPDPDVVDDSHAHSASTLTGVIVNPLTADLNVGTWNIAGTGGAAAAIGGNSGGVAIFAANGHTAAIGNDAGELRVNVDGSVISIGGGQTLDVTGTIGGVTDPGTAQQAATKHYVDGIVTFQAGSPVGGGFLTTLVRDTTAVTGALYGWNGSDYAKIAPV